jgi:hypothetical protein
VEKKRAIQGAYETNTWLIEKLTAGLTHTESVLQLPFPANCLNWILGHVLSRRNTALQLLAAGSLWDEEILSLYRSGSAPITAGENARRFEDLLGDLQESQRRITEALDRSTPEVLETRKETDRGAKPVWQHLEGLHWHETYHVGQLEVLRGFIMAERGEEHG